VGLTVIRNMTNTDINIVQAKNWCFTINNYSIDDIQRLEDVIDQTNLVNYMVYGKEVGEQGTPHLQCYVQFSVRKRFRQVKNLLGPKAHIEHARGSAFEASMYCKKDEDFTEYGRLSNSGMFDATYLRLLMAQ